VERIDCLRRLAAATALPPLAPKTFWEVAGIFDGRELLIVGAGTGRRLGRASARY
jgi:hypothetical protein